MQRRRNEPPGPRGVAVDLVLRDIASAGTVCAWKTAVNIADHCRLQPLIADALPRAAFDFDMLNRLKKVTNRISPG